ncbi:unnamed protein product, partial (macronuclear) [Paramecium tetraurelia]
VGCRDSCDLDSQLYDDGFCQSFPSIIFNQNYLGYQIEIATVQIPISSDENLKWLMIYDPKHLDKTPTIITPYSITYGVFKFKSGIYRYFKQLPSYVFGTYLIGLRITIELFNDLPINCGIQFKINNHYHGSIYRNISGIQTHNIRVSASYIHGSYQQYSQTTQLELISFIDIPKSQFVFSAVGDYE